MTFAVSCNCSTYRRPMEKRTLPFNPRQVSWRIRALSSIVALVCIVCFVKKTLFSTPQLLGGHYWLRVLHRKYPQIITQPYLQGSVWPSHFGPVTITNKFILRAMISLYELLGMNFGSFTGSRSRSTYIIKQHAAPFSRVCLKGTALILLVHHERRKWNATLCWHPW
jgi:hypothetical protein